MCSRLTTASMCVRKTQLGDLNIRLYVPSEVEIAGKFDRNLGNRK